MSIEPDAIPVGGDCELPEYRCFAAAFGITLEVMFEEACGNPGSQVMDLRIEQSRDIVPPHFGRLAENFVEHERATDSHVPCMARIVD